LAAERAAWQTIRRASAKEIMHNATLQQAYSVFQQRYADIRSDADLQRLSYQNPQRYAQLQQDAKIVQDGIAQSQRGAALRTEAERQIAQHQAAQWQKQFQSWAKEQADIVEKEMPELKDPQQARAFQQGLVEMLHEHGINREMVHADPHLARVIYSAEGQRVLADAVRWRTAQKRLASMSATPPPPVQRPGVASDRSAYREERVQRMNGRLNAGRTEREQLRAAADLLKARRGKA
jgi:hypothetical protein